MGSRSHRLLSIPSPWTAGFCLIAARFAATASMAFGTALRRASLDPAMPSLYQKSYRALRVDRLTIETVLPQRRSG